MAPEINSSQPHPARIYDYFIGGDNHFAVDRETAAQVLRRSPAAQVAARENRAFLGRAVRYLTAEAGITQFLDIGSGLPATNNVHQVAQAISPSAPGGLRRQRPARPRPRPGAAGLSAGGTTAYLHGDLRDPAAILSHPAARAVLDFGQPVALMLVAVLHFIPDEYQPAQIIATLLDALPPGSYLAASHLTTQHDPAATSAGQQTMREAGMTMQKRDSDVFAGLAFSGLELVPPGVVLASQWRPAGDGPRPAPAEVNCYAGVARKP